MVREQWYGWLRGASELLKPRGLDYDDVLLLIVVHDIATRTIYPSQRHLVKELGLGKVEISRSLARLERNGLICRRSREWADLRKRHSYPTDAGVAFLQECETHFASLRRALYIEPFLDENAPEPTLQPCDCRCHL